MRVKVNPRPIPMARDRPAGQQKRNLVWYTDAEGFESLTCSGYTTLAHSPEVSTAVDTYARLIGAMTIHLMRNGPSGDVRIRNELSRIVDIQPNAYMTRSAFISWIVRTLYLEGRGNAVVLPITRNGRLEELRPIPAAYAAFVPEGLWSYAIDIAGTIFRPEEVLHFTLNPSAIYPWMGEGFQIQLTDVADSLKQAAATSKGFMESKWKPSLIVRVDAMADEFSGPQGRQKLIDEYITESKAGQPWLLPAELFDVQQVRPLTLSDLALSEFVTLDKKTVATILGIPPFVLGVGTFNRDEWNSFVSTSIMPRAQALEQEFTRKLIPEEDLFFRFNSRSLLNYSMSELIQAGAEMVDRMAMRRNEWRDWMGLEPDEDMDDLLALENYIPADRLGDQAKLTGGNNE